MLNIMRDINVRDSVLSSRVGAAAAYQEKPE